MCWSVTRQLLKRPGPQENFHTRRSDVIVDRDKIVWSAFNVLRKIGQEVVALHTRRNRRDAIVDRDILLTQIGLNLAHGFRRILGLNGGDHQQLLKQLKH